MEAILILVIGAVIFTVVVTRILNALERVIYYSFFLIWFLVTLWSYYIIFTNIEYLYPIPTFVLQGIEGPVLFTPLNMLLGFSVIGTISFIILRDVVEDLRSK